jgi:hypothetical protein
MAPDHRTGDLPLASYVIGCAAFGMTNGSLATEALHIRLCLLFVLHSASYFFLCQDRITFYM